MPEVNNAMDLVMQFQDNPPVEIADLINKLEIRYQEIPMPDGNSGRIDHDGSGFLISVNANEGPQRRRFTAAHELGHYLLHRDRLQESGHLDRLFSGPGNNPYEPFSPQHEVQANRFAANMLMPGRTIKRMYEEGHRRAAELARTFDVSQQAMRYRLQNLGLE